MNWEAIGSIGEILSATAVLITLIYLSLQIRHNTAATKAQIHQARSDQSLDFFLFNASSGDFIEILRKVYDESGLHPDPAKVDELDWVERRRLLFWCVANQQRIENMYYQYRRGFLEEETYKSVFLPISRQIPLWEVLGLLDAAGSEFAAEVDRIRDHGT